MPVIGNFSVNRGVDGVISLQMAPPVAIGGWPLQVLVTRRFGSSSGLIEAYANSGYNNVSGINILNSGAGIFTFGVPASVTSGLDPGNYACEIRRLTSGQQTLLFQGYLELKP